jgi:hypothetical protein
MTHSSSGQQVQPLGAGGQAGDEGDGKTSSFVQYFYLECTDFFFCTPQPSRLSSLALGHHTQAAAIVLSA